MYGYEKKGGLPREERRMDAFCTVLADCHLVDIITYFLSLLKEKIMNGLKEVSSSKLGGFLRRLDRWASQIRQSRKVKKEVLIAKLVELMESDKDDENLVELIDTKIQLNFEIEKDERYWEQRA
ncbi:hypothetical protein EPI10_030638 [Gossypium australe]|uniref:Uncharacterized protein n=1 Tax=Gossypium australe TaxID=47621 RepID=A0A5B6X106_9ROSI|nr:hypothetical protein EPI10_030638 [Gossypium australe]